MAPALGVTLPAPAARAGKPGIVFFDLDHTLLDGDSDVLWCDFLIDEGLLDAAEFGARNAAMARGYAAGTVGVREFCDFYIGTLAGRTPSRWQPLTQRFLNERIVPRLRSGTTELLRVHRARGDTLVLTTATNRLVAAPTAAHLGFEHLIATECETAADGRLSGRSTGTPNMRAGKVERLHAWLLARGERLADCTSAAYSDSINDLPLLEAVDEAVVVHPDARLAAVAAARGWRVLRL